MWNQIMEEDIREIYRHTDVIEAFAGSSVLISGATGFIGSHLIHLLLENPENIRGGTRVIAIVRDARKAEKMYPDFTADGRMILIEQDVREEIKYRGHVDYVIHCASNAAPKEYDEDPVGTMNTNFAGTDHLLQFALRAEVKRFLYVSTIEIYGTQKEGDGLIGEEDYGIISSVNPRSCYPLSKKACETLCISYGKQYGLPVSIGRLSYIFGPGMKPGDSKIAACFPEAVAENKNIVLKSRGLQKRSYCYVSDAVSGLLTILLRGENQQAYNIASEIAVTTVSGMAERLVELFPEKGLKVEYELPTDAEKGRFSTIRDAVLDSKKLQSLGWAPCTSFDEGMKKTVKYYEMCKKTEGLK